MTAILDKEDISAVPTKELLQCKQTGKWAYLTPSGVAKMENLYRLAEAGIKSQVCCLCGIDHRQNTTQQKEN